MEVEVMPSSLHTARISTLDAGTVIQHDGVIWMVITGIDETPVGNVDIIELESGVRGYLPHTKVVYLVQNGKFVGEL